MIDLDRLKEITGNDPQEMDSLIRQFLALTEDDLERLHQAILKKNHPEVAHLAHRIKGSSATLGATPLARLAGALENQARASAGDYHRLYGQMRCSFKEITYPKGGE